MRIGSDQDTAPVAPRSQSTPRRGYSSIHYDRLRDDIGPYQGSHPDSDQQFVSFGTLDIPAVDGMHYTPSVDELGRIHTLSLIVNRQCVELTLFAAPKSGGLWMTTYDDLNSSARKRGFHTFALTGIWGKELLLRPSDPGMDIPYLFAGIEGRGWLLRVVYFGAAAENPQVRASLDAVVANCVIHRDNKMRPPGSLIYLIMPDQAQSSDKSKE